MKKSEIKVDGVYRAKVSGRIVQVKVLAIHKAKKSPARKNAFGGESRVTYQVLNLITGRETTFKSAAKFRGRVPFNHVKGVTPEQILQVGLKEQDDYYTGKYKILTEGTDLIAFVESHVLENTACKFKFDYTLKRWKRLDPKLDKSSLKEVQ